MLFSWTLNIQKHKKSFGITFHAFSTETWNIAIYSKVIDMIRRWVAEGGWRWWGECKPQQFSILIIAHLSVHAVTENLFFFSLWSLDWNIDSESFDGSSKLTLNQRPRTVTLCWMLSAKILSKVIKDHLFLIFIQVDFLNTFRFLAKVNSNVSCNNSKKKTCHWSSFELEIQFQLWSLNYLMSNQINIESLRSCKKQIFIYFMICFYSFIK